MRHSPSASDRARRDAHRSGPWIPDWVRQVDATTLRWDATAGLLGAILVLPQAIAFSALAGLPPVYGIHTAIVSCIVAALAGSSLHVMSGPTNANSLALIAMVSALAAPGTDRYLELVFAVTLLVGLLQWLTGVLRLGAIANFISPTALFGFTSGAAALIAIHAVQDVVRVPTDETRLAGLVVAGVVAASGLLLRLWRPRWPYLLVALVVGTLLAWALARWNASWQLHRLGSIPLALPHPHVPAVTVEDLPRLIGPAAALTVIALAQSISIAKVVAERSGQHIDANREFIGQGLSNIAGGLMQCYVSCGSLNRSMPNYESGARTPLASVFSSLMLIPLVLLAGPLLAWIPDAAVSGLLVVVAWTLMDWRRAMRLARESRAEFLVAGATMLATLVLPLQVAVLIGSAMSLGLYLQRTAHPAMRTMGFDSTASSRRFVVLDHRRQAGVPVLPECPQLKLLRMEGPVYFGAAAHVQDGLRALRDGPLPQSHLLVMAKSMNFIDIAGVDLWRQEMNRRRQAGGDLYFHRPRPDVMDAWEKAGFIDQIGADHLFPDKHSAIATIVQRLDPLGCARCRARVFSECALRPDDRVTNP